MIMRSEDILGYSVATVSPEACVEELVKGIDAVSEGEAGEGAAAKPFWLACLNPHSVHMAMSDPAAEEALKAADILIPDGVGVMLASRILGGGIRERITGSDIFRELSRRLNDRGGAAYFFLGSTEETLAAIETRLADEFPRIRFAGAYSPLFKEVFSEEENRAMIKAINRAGPDVLWVGMTAPKQEKWIYQNKDKLNVKFIGAVGAVFDFYAGNVKRSHPWFLEHGLEWLPRLLQEPRRLWRRTFISASVFFWLVFLQRIRKWVK
jgi:N-acetylglucosaminyldiphosphoundecaprenol N-acetyl-beta-D-mannosaminyltransferase